MIANNPSTLAFVPGMVETDVGRFRLLARSSDRAALAEAAEVYAGPLLDRFPPVGGDFDDWLIVARREVTDAAIASLRRLTDACLAAGDVAPAVLAAERMLALDLLREDSHRLMMEVYLRAGRRADAIRQYDACVEVLRRELDVAPSEETEGVAAGARAHGAIRSPVQTSEVMDRLHVSYASPSGGPPWVAVLPFKTIGGDPVPGYFAAGVVQDIVTMLAVLREPIVVSTHSSDMFRDGPRDLRSIGHTLGVHYVVTGTARHSPPWLRISVELAKVDDGAVLWAQSYDTKDFTLFDAQDTIARKVVYTVVPKIFDSELRRVRAKRPESLTAYDLVLQGREAMFRLDRGAYERAGITLRQAVDIDPGYATAHAQLADWYALLIGQGWSSGSGNDVEACDLAARSAIERDTLNPKALALHAHIRSFLYRDYDSAARLFDVALDAAPNDGSTWMWSACTYAYINNPHEAVNRAETALRLSPQDPLAFRYLSTLCIAKYTAGAFEDAAHWGEKAIQANPSYTANLRFTIASLVGCNQMQRATELARQLMVVQPDFHVSPVRGAHPFRDAEQRNILADRLICAGLPE